MKSVGKVAIVIVIKILIFDRHEREETAHRFISRMTTESERHERKPMFSIMLILKESFFRNRNILRDPRMGSEIKWLFIFSIYSVLGFRIHSLA